MFARFIPFKLWAIIYPYTSNIEYFLDENQKILINRIGIYENIQIELNNVFEGIDIKFGSSLPLANESRHKGVEYYFKNRLFKVLINFKVRKDLEFYNSVFERVKKMHK